MAIRIRSSENPEMDRTFRGHWHTRDQPDPIPGSLTFSQENGILLDLSGSLLGQDQTQFGPKQVLGRAFDGTFLTIDRGHYEGQIAPWFEDQSRAAPIVAAEEWGGWALIVGAQLPQGGRTTIRQLRFRSPMLRAWTTWHRPKYTRLYEEGVAGGQIELKSPVTAQISGGTIDFNWHIMESGSQFSSDIRFVPEFHVKFDEDIKIDDAWTKIVIPLLQFLTFCVGAGDSAEGVVMNQSMEEDPTSHTMAQDSHGGPLWGGWFEWCSTSWMARPGSQKAPHEAQLVCRAPQDDAEFARLLSKWFESYDHLKPALFDFLSINMWAQMTIEESFYRAVRSLEVVHGILNPAPHIPREDFKRIKQKIKLAVEGEPYGEFVRNRLSHADAPTLRERLEDLVENAGPRLRNRLRFDDVIPKVVRARNELTHAGALESSAEEELHELFHLMIMLMNTTLLRELGYDPLDTED